MNDNFNNNMPNAGTTPTPPRPSETPAYNSEPTEPPTATPTEQNNAPSYTQQGTSQYQPAYYPQYSQPYAPEQPQQARPYNQQNQQPPVTPQPEVSKKPRKKRNIGKIIFVTIVCICIVVASIGLGASLSANNNNVEKPKSTEASEKSTSKGDGANAIVEDSPLSFSKYSGKGAMTPEQVYEAVKEINVGVLVYSQGQKSGEGSGIIVGEDPTGKYTYIITAAHVISASGVDIQVQFFDDSEAEATIVGVDTKTDIGVLKVEKTGFKAATFGNSDKLTVGQTVYAIGNPGGTEFFGSFTSGMISAIDRPVPTTNSSYDLPCIQHNAAINPGNSGGALVNEYGQVVGLNSSKISSTEYEGMGFSVPSNTMIEIYNELIKNGYVSNRPMLGITYSPVSSDYTYAAVAWKNNLPYGSIAIATINESSDIANHDIQVGDIITKVNGKELETTDILLEEIEESKVGDTLELTVCRIGRGGTITKTFTASVKLVEDKGNNTVEETTTENNPFGSYFDNFGY